MEVQQGSEEGVNAIKRCLGHERPRSVWENNFRVALDSHRAGAESDSKKDLHSEQ